MVLSARLRMTCIKGKCTLGMRWFGAKSLPVPMLTYCELNHKKPISLIFYFTSESFNIRHITYKMAAMLSRSQCFNTLAPGRFQRNFWKIIFQMILVIDGWSISCKIGLEWMSMDLTNGKSTLVQVMAWCCQALHEPMSPITWTNVDQDPCRHMASLDHNELIATR